MKPDRPNIHLHRQRSTQHNDAPRSAAPEHKGRRERRAPAEGQTRRDGDAGEERDGAEVEEDAAEKRKEDDLDADEDADLDDDEVGPDELGDAIV